MAVLVQLGCRGWPLAGSLDFGLSQRATGRSLSHHRTAKSQLAREASLRHAHHRKEDHTFPLSSDPLLEGTKINLS